jgi:hypothetical protein
MAGENDPFHDLDVKEVIDLRWTLRDIRLSGGNCPLSTRPIWKN